MYRPYFRGKQFELLTLRETAPLLASNGFIPIIEPVREALGGLEKALKALDEAGSRAVVIINPHHGDHNEDGANITKLLKEGFIGNDAVAAGVLLRSSMTVDDAMACYHAHADHFPVFVHAGFTEPRALAEAFGSDLPGMCNAFVDSHSKLLYWKHFSAGERVLIRDGFNRQKNADYPPVEEFSDLHVTYKELGMAGFGDFLTVGDAYSEGGGPAYAVAIHLTYIDPDKDDVMYIYHFVSDTNSSPADPAGKFGQALAKLIKKLEGSNSKLLETSAIAEFRDLHAKGHFPGLGYVKKLSMKHHIETLAAFLG